MTNKHDIRRVMKDRIALVDRAADSAAILRHLEALVPRDGPVLAFLPLADEPDISPLADRLAAEGRLVLVEGRGGGAHLAPAASAPVLALVPGRAFDRRGTRLGRGGGTFDRILAKLACPRAGVGYDEQVVESLPVEPHDAPLDLLVTPGGVIRFPKP